MIDIFTPNPPIKNKTTKCLKRNIKKVQNHCGNVVEACKTNTHDHFMEENYAKKRDCVTFHCLSALFGCLASRTTRQATNDDD